MFDFFKREKHYGLELHLLAKILLRFPEEYKYLSLQINSGLVKGFFYQSKPINNYFGFSYDPAKLKDFLNKMGRSFVLKGVKILNKHNNEFIGFDVFVAQGLIAGYSLSKNSKFIPDIESTNCEGIYKNYLEDFSLGKLAEIFTESQIKLLNPSQIYELELKGKVYYHIQDMEDGDFIAIGEDRRVYKITHDPFEIILSDQDLFSVLKY